jgi:hypothetical protein
MSDIGNFSVNAIFAIIGNAVSACSIYTTPRNVLIATSF